MEVYLDYSDLVNLRTSVDFIRWDGIEVNYYNDLQQVYDENLV